MKRTNKKRLNLYLNKDTIQFAKKWSYVTNKPISQMLEEQLTRQRELVSSISPFQWLSDPVINPTAPKEDEHYKDIEEYLDNKNEEEFCEQNPEHPRAKMRRALLQEYEKYVAQTVERKKENDKDLIQRWMEVFPK